MWPAQCLHQTALTEVDTDMDHSQEARSMHLIPMDFQETHMNMTSPLTCEQIKLGMFCIASFPPFKREISGTSKLRPVNLCSA